jgi:hypothetical protein
MLIIILTHSITKYLIKSDRPGCKTEYFASSTYEEAERLTLEEKEREKNREICVLCNGGDNLSNNIELSRILNRLEDYYI